MNRCVQKSHVPKWMTKGRTTLIQKDPCKETSSNNYKPITCPPIMGKILTAQIREEIYFSLKTANCSPNNCGNATKDLEAQNYSKFISTSSTKARQDGKI